MVINFQLVLVYWSIMQTYLKNDILNQGWFNWIKTNYKLLCCSYTNFKAFCKGSLWFIIEISSEYYSECLGHYFSDYFLEQKYDILANTVRHDIKDNSYSNNIITKKNIREQKSVIFNNCLSLFLHILKGKQ